VPVPVPVPDRARARSDPGTLYDRRMPRRAALLLALLPGCFEETTPPGSDDTAATSAPSTTADDADATMASPDGSTSAAMTSADATSDDAADAEGEAESDTTASTGEPPSTCEWPLDWLPTPRKDLLVVVHTDPPNLGAVLMDAQAYAGDEIHVAVASSCGTNCGAAAGYEHHTLAFEGVDPVTLASEVHADVTVFRPFIRDHVLVVTGVDTTVDEPTFMADPELAATVLHVRYLQAGGCSPGTQLEMLAMATGGSFQCADFTGPDVLEDDLALPQPSCELFGDVRNGPGPGVPADQLTLEGETMQGPGEIVLGGPGACRNEPDGWTIIDAPLGHLGLCPVTCRDVARWAPQELAATVAFECR
jgi:hypothetical protein